MKRASVKGPIQGEHADIIVVDDLGAIEQRTARELFSDDPMPSDPEARRDWKLYDVGKQQILDQLYRSYVLHGSETGRFSSRSPSTPKVNTPSNTGNAREISDSISHISRGHARANEAIVTMLQNEIDSLRAELARTQGDLAKLRVSDATHDQRMLEMMREDRRQADEIQRLNETIEDLLIAAFEADDLRTTGSEFVKFEVKTRVDIELVQVVKAD